MREVRQAVIDGETLQTILIMRATGGTSIDEHRYAELRKKFMANPQLKRLLPDFVQKYRDVGGFWHFIKHHLATYAERRTFLYDAFAPLLRQLESASIAPVDAVAAEALDLRPEFEFVRAAWQKTIDRRDTDADGAITISRTLLESLLKHILDELGVPYDAKADLQPLYGVVAKELGLSPGTKDAAGKDLPEGAKQVLSGCFSIVQGFAALRNQLSDAHGKGRSSMRAEDRHAELAVNVSFALATFLVRTLDRKKGGSTRTTTATPR